MEIENMQVSLVEGGVGKSSYENMVYGDCTKIYKIRSKKLKKTVYVLIDPYYGFLGYWATLTLAKWKSKYVWSNKCDKEQNDREVWCAKVLTNMLSNPQENMEEINNLVYWLEKDDFPELKPIDPILWRKEHGLEY